MMINMVSEKGVCTERKKDPCVVKRSSVWGFECGDLLDSQPSKP